LGGLHSGFYENLPELVRQLMADITPCVQVIVTGHSKGAGEGAQLAALLRLAGANVANAILFACPRAGQQKLTNWLRSNIHGISFRNSPSPDSLRGDPVPMVPLPPYSAPYPLTHICAPPAGLLRVLSVEWHMGALYIAGTKTLT